MDQTSYERQPATFEVELVDPNAPITWFVKGKEIKDDDDNYEIQKVGAVHRLIIKSSSMQAHEGEVKVREAGSWWEEGERQSPLWW